MDAKERFEKIKSIFPEKFVQTPFVENSDFLKRVGVTIPNKNALPRGLVKAFATDFIVEEVGLDGSVVTVDYPASESGMISGEYGGTHFATLVKCGMTTFEAVKLVQEMLGTKPDSVRYAGIKDVNAVTAQRISIRGARPEAFAQVNHPRFFLKDLTAGKGAIATGDLQGNRFSILVRTPTASQVGQLENEWQSRFTHVAEQGFYNFFYLQRFSSPRYINHEWGRDIIGGHYEKAVRSILCDESPTELPFFGEMRRWFRDHYGSWTDIREFIDETFPEALYVERALAAHLEAYPGDFVGALRTNEKQVMMWVYAYSSKLFNESISSYILSGREVPATLPLVVSHDREDIALYRRMLERDGLFPPNWMHLRPFPSIRTAHREVHTKSRVQLHRVEFVPEGVRCSFTLEKGEYATTFLAHLFNLVGGIDRETDTEFSRTEASSIDLRTRAYFDSVLTKVGEPEDT